MGMSSKEPSVQEARVEPTGMERASAVPLQRVSVAAEQPAQDPEPDPASSSTSAPALDAPTQEERRVFASSVFEAQFVDRSWAIDARQSLESKLESVRDPAVKVSAIECRSTLCRFEIDAEEPSARQDFMRKMIRANVGAGMAVPSSDQTDGSIIVYIAREGTSLPEPSLE